MKNSVFEQFETEVMDRIIAEDSIIAEVLEKQYKSARVISREFSGVGFFTNYEISDNSLRLADSLNLELGNTQARLEGLKHGVGFVLFIRDGLIKTLECFTYGEPWPAIITAYSFE